MVQNNQGSSMVYVLFQDLTSVICSVCDVLLCYLMLRQLIRKVKQFYAVIYRMD